MSALLLLLAALASYRGAVLIALERGPFDLAQKLRGAIEARVSPPTPERPYVHWLVFGIGCPKCVSFWLALPAAALALYLAGINGWGWLWWLPLAWLGVAGGALFCYEVTHR